MIRFSTCALVFALCGWASMQTTKPQTSPLKEQKTLNLGNFSVSLNVKDIAASREFYEKLGFRAIAGEQDRKWLIMQNETATIGLFQGAFERNALTFNPGWDRNAKTLAEFDDVRKIQNTLKARGLNLTTSTDESKTGPAFIALADPDGNPILIDQHVSKPSK